MELASSDEGLVERTSEGVTADRSSSPLHTLTLSSLLVVIALALTLRLWGIGWSLPNDRRLGSYHPDEAVNLIRGVLENGQQHPHIDLGFYNYGGLYFYLWQAGVAANGTYGVIHQERSAIPVRSATDTFASMILVGRILTAVLGALTVWAVFALGRRLYGDITGTVAAALYAIMPAAAIHGHFATVDVPATFFVTVALATGARIAMSEQFRGRDVALAGVVCGLAAATKYNCGLVLLAPLAALWWRNPHPLPSSPNPGRGGTVPETDAGAPFLGGAAGIGTKGSALLIGSAILGFLIGCPGVLINPSGFWRDFTFELFKSGKGAGTLFVDTAPGWIYHLTESLRLGLGLPLLGLCIAAGVWSMRQRFRQDWYLLAFLVPYYLLIGFAQVKYLRYVIPLLPVLAVLTGRFVSDALYWRSLLPRVVAVAGWVAAGNALIITLALDGVMARAAAQDRANAYIQSQVPKGASIGFATTPWFYSPPLSPMFTAPQPDQVRNEAAREVTEYSLRVPARNTAWDSTLLNPPPDWFILSDIGDLQDATRLHLAAAQPFLELFQERYRPIVFENRPVFLGIDLGKPAYSPPDWLYIDPRITMYQRIR